MTATLGIDLHGEPIERVRADVAVVTFFSGERPLRGSAGRADWRLCGRLSELIAAGRLDGRSGEAALATTCGGLRAPLLVALGLGRREAFDADALAETARQAAGRSLELGAGSLALSLADLAPAAPALRLRVEAVLAGAALAVAERSAELHLRLLIREDERAEVGEALRKGRARGLRKSVVLRLPAPTPPHRANPRDAALGRAASPGPPAAIK